MDELRPVSRVYILVLVSLALAAVVIAVVAAGWPTPQQMSLAVVLFSLVVLAWSYPIPFGHRKKQVLDTAVVFAAVLLLPASAALAAAGLGTLLAHALRKSLRVPIQAMFNAAQITLQAATGFVVLSIAGWNHLAAPIDQTRYWPAIVGAAIAMVVVNLLAVATIIGLESGTTPMYRSIQQQVDAHRPLALPILAQYGIGLLAVVVLGTQPFAILLLVFPVIMAQRVLTHQIQSQLRTETLLASSQASLAEAQRIAHLGNWEWDLTTGHQHWSDEVYRILGFRERGFGPTREIFLACVHPDDLDQVAATLEQIRLQPGPFGLDCRVRQPDGGERVVHLHGEIVGEAADFPTRVVGILHDITERQQLERQLSHLAFHDGLTGLPNRILFMRHLDDALTRARHSPTPQTVSILFLDLDRFKIVNDSLGHEAGDELLIAVSRRLRANVRSDTLIGRLGGDEFTILLESVNDPEDPSRVAARLAAALQSPVTITGPDDRENRGGAATDYDRHREVVVSASIGIVTSGPGRDGAVDLLRLADIAMYRAKRDGGARHARFDPGMDAEVRARLDLERDLRGALSRREFELHYQPIVSLGDDRVVALEALLRWRHPKIGLLGPDTFLSVIEETGLVVPIGRWVMQEACSQLKLWRTELGENAPERVAVNLSVRQAIQPDLVADVATALDQSDLDPAMLEIELTEHALMDHSATATRALHGLSRLGVRLGIDDFGAGYSSFGRLQHLPIDHLKIDRSFLQNMLKDPTSNVLIGAMAGLGRALRLEVTAEGIEFEAEVVRLTELGCDYGQGHFFAAAMPAETVTTFLTARPRREIEPAAADPGTVVPFPTGRVASK